MRDATSGSAAPRSSLFVGMMAGLVGGVACGVVTWLALGGREGSSGPAPPLGNTAASDATALRTAIDALRDDIARLQLASAGSHADGPADAHPAALGPTEPATHADIAVLAEALQRLSERLDASLAPRLSPLKPDPAKREALRAYVDPKHRMPADSYALWTEAQLLEAYGPPSYVAPFGNGYQWGYQLEDAGKRIRFEFVGGRVVDYGVE